MLKEDANRKRKDRHSITQEDFTPVNICEVMFREAEELYTDFSKTMLDPCCGIGNLLIYCLEHRLNYCKTSNDIYAALSSLYGTELMEDNVNECKERIIKLLNNTNIIFDNETVMKILNNNIVCTNSNDWDYENWTMKPKYETPPLF